MNLAISSLSFLIFVNIALAQYYTKPPIIPNQISNTQAISKDQLLSYLLSSNNRELPERIETLASAIQLMPSRENRRDQLADILKESALENLKLAASVCDTNKVPFASLRAAPNEITSSILPRRQHVGANAAANELNSPVMPRRQYVVANAAANELTSPILPRRKYVVANTAANELNTSVLPRRQYVVANAAANELASPIVPRRQYVVANTANEPVARDLAAMLPADLLSLIADFVPNSVRYQYI